MFEEDMERLEHEIDNALLFYCVARDYEEQERCLLEAAEASLKRLWCCRDVLQGVEQIEGFARQVHDYLTISDSILHEGVSKFVRIEHCQADGHWCTLTAQALPLYEELMNLLSIEPSMAMGCH